MSEYVKRERYLQRLVGRRDNGDVKIITGPRRPGKSFLLKTIYRDYLVSQGVPQENIIIVSPRSGRRGTCRTFLLQGILRRAYGNPK